MDDGAIGPPNTVPVSPSRQGCYWNLTSPHLYQTTGLWLGRPAGQVSNSASGAKSALQKVHSNGSNGGGWMYNR
jgi:hypothetical protein